MKSILQLKIKILELLNKLDELNSKGGKNNENQK
ncbi:Uncharacterised protein [Clostridium cochlearium]|uniref:Uncharacterized protein n=1 Tax=Clostridium cochlearium TaxID=1494 RepID=A0A2X2W7Q7_CLOCO|nr:Uncharacterised protein [Clostridium cochlearium]